MPKVKTKRFYWKGTLVSEAIYNLRLKQHEAGKNLRNVYGTKNLKSNLKVEEKEYRNSKHADLKDEGYKIVNIENIAHQLICKKFHLDSAQRTMLLVASVNIPMMYLLIIITPWKNRSN